MNYPSGKWAYPYFEDGKFVGYSLSRERFTPVDNSVDMGKGGVE